MRWFRVALCAFVLVALPSFVHGQTVIDPVMVEFTPSPDHSAALLDGSPIVASYELQAIAQNATGAIAITKGLGKPAPNSQGLIAAMVPEFATLTPGAVYTATVSAVGPGGRTASAPSGPFGRVGMAPAPRAPTGVKVRPQ